MQGWDYRDEGWDLRASIYGWTQHYQQLGPEDHQGACSSNIWNSKLGLTAGKTQKLLDYCKCRGEAYDPAYLDNKRLSQLFSEMVHAMSLDSAGCFTTGGGSNVSWSAKEICIFLLACLGFTWKADILGQIFDNDDDNEDEDEDDNDDNDDNDNEDEEDQAGGRRQPINKVNPIIHVHEQLNCLRWPLFLHKHTIAHRICLTTQCWPRLIYFLTNIVHERYLPNF